MRQPERRDAGKRQGEGTMRYADGQEASGEWTDGMLDAQTSRADAPGDESPPEESDSGGETAEGGTATE